MVFVGALIRTGSGGQLDGDGLGGGQRHEGGGEEGAVRSKPPPIRERACSTTWRSSTSPEAAVSLVNGDALRFGGMRGEGEGGSTPSSSGSTGGGDDCVRSEWVSELVNESTANPSSTPLLTPLLLPY